MTERRCRLARVNDGGRRLSSAAQGRVGVEFIAVSFVRVGDDALELERPAPADEDQHLIGWQLLNLVGGQKRVTVLCDTGGRAAAACALASSGSAGGDRPKPGGFGGPLGRAVIGAPEIEYPHGRA